MNRTPAQPRHDSGARSKKTFSAASAALAAALLSLNASELRAASGTWQANPADQGVNVTITSDGSSWSVAPQLVEGDAIYVGTTTGINLGTNNYYYYVVGVGSTPSSVVRFSSGPASIAFNSNTAGTLDVTKVPSWFTTGNWADGIVPNGIDDQATLTANASTASILIDHNLTLGALNVDTTISSVNGVNLIASSRKSGPAGTPPASWITSAVGGVILSRSSEPAGCPGGCSCAGRPGSGPQHPESRPTARVPEQPLGRDGTVRMDV